MTPDTLLAAAAGIAAAAGVACAVAAVVLPPPPPGRPPARWRRLLAQWRVSPRSAVLAVIAGAAVLAITGWPVAALAAVPAVIALPRILSRKPARARIAKLEALEMWTRQLADLLAASRGLEDAITTSVSSVPPAIAPAVTALAAGLSQRVGTETALRRFAGSVDDPIGDLIATALMMAAQRRGPGVRAVLTELAGEVASDVAGRREAEAERASYRTSLMWIIAFLGAYTLFLLLRRGYSAPFGTPAGQVVMAVVAGCYAGGLYWLHRLSFAFGPSRFLHAHQPGSGPGPGASGNSAPMVIRR